MSIRPTTCPRRPAQACPDAADDLRRLHERLAAAAQAEGILDVAYRTVDTPVGPLLLAATEQGLVRVAFAARGPRRGAADAGRPGQPADPARARPAGRGRPASSTSTSPAAAHAFDLPLDWRLSAGFRAHRAAPPARRSATGTPRATPRSPQLAGNPKAVRAVGTACATNPLPVVVPCHRVVRSDGSMGGYRGGAEAKRTLLDPGGGAHEPATSLAPGRPGRRRRLGRGPRRAGRATAAALTGPLLSRREAGRDRRALRRRRRGSGPPSTWPGTGSARASTATSPSRSRRRSTELKQALYPRLLPIARDWWQPARPAGAVAGRPGRVAGDVPRRRPDASPPRSCCATGPGDWNALHRDLYGDLVFPLQVVINLNDPGVDHTGGEFLLYEQRPRAQSRGTATLIPHGHGLVFTTRDRPVRVAARLVGGAGPARRVGDPLRRAVHPRPRLPRRRLSRRV